MREDDVDEGRILKKATYVCIRKAIAASDSTATRKTWNLYETPATIPAFTPRLKNKLLEGVIKEERRCCRAGNKQMLSNYDITVTKTRWQQIRKKHPFLQRNQPRS
jgi:hypothetical protein